MANMTKKQEAELKAFDRFVAEVGTGDLGRTILADRALKQSLRKAHQS